jgi:hypothetical protein
LQRADEREFLDDHKLVGSVLPFGGIGGGSVQGTGRLHLLSR